jgi:hypothetical protein
MRGSNVETYHVGHNLGHNFRRRTSESVIQGDLNRDLFDGAVQVRAEFFRVCGDIAD